jgi:hypothetical protein
MDVITKEYTAMYMHGNRIKSTLNGRRVLSLCLCLCPH